MAKQIKAWYENGNIKYILNKGKNLNTMRCWSQKGSHLITFKIKNGWVKSIVWEKDNMTREEIVDLMRNFKISLIETYKNKVKKRRKIT